MKVRAWLVGGFAVLTLAIVASGWRSVEPGEVVVVRRLGRALSDSWGPGAHWAWPLGIDKTTRLRIDEVRRLEFGLNEAPGPLDAPGSGEYLTGDQNIVKARGVVQYRVADPVAFLLRSDDRDQLLSRSTEAALARALASRGIDAPLQAGRPEIALDIEQSLKRSVESLGLGVAILGVNLTDARPPVEVEPAFVEAQSAQSERDRRINEAKALPGKLRPAAKATAESTTNQARAVADREVTLARGQAARFLDLLAEADRSWTLTVRRLYRDALRDLLPRIRRKVLLTPDEPVDLGIFGPGVK